MTTTKAVRVSLLADAVRAEAFAEASRFRGEFYECLTARRDELFELADAVLCADGAVKSPVDLTLLPEHRRGHGAMYGGLDHGRIDVNRLRTVLAGLPLPRFDGGRLVLAVSTPRAPAVTASLKRNRRAGPAPNPRTTAWADPGEASPPRSTWPANKVSGRCPCWSPQVSVVTALSSRPF